jgi:hypothetical protein
LHAGGGWIGDGSSFDSKTAAARIFATYLLYVHFYGQPVAIELIQLVLDVGQRQCFTRFARGRFLRGRGLRLLGRLRLFGSGRFWFFGSRGLQFFDSGRLRFFGSCALHLCFFCHGWQGGGRLTLAAKWAASQRRQHQQCTQQQQPPIMLLHQTLLLLVRHEKA